MESQQIYKKSNNTKSLEEWLNSLKKQEMVLKELKREIQFYTTLLYRPIFKSRVMNLYETLARFKYDLGHLEENRLKLLSKISHHINDLTDKIKYKDIVLDAILIDTLNDLESEIYNYFDSVSSLKLKLFEYIESTILD
jgi:hypothetical protein